MVYVVSYDLRKPGKDYVGLTEQLRAYPISIWWHYLASTWLVSTSENATQLYNRLIPHLDQGDSILIIEAGTHMEGWLPKDAWELINQMMPGVLS